MIMCRLHKSIPRASAVGMNNLQISERTEIPERHLLDVLDVIVFQHSNNETKANIGHRCTRQDINRNQ